MAILSFHQRSELASNAPTSVLQAVAQGNSPPEPYASATDLIGPLTAGAELGIRNRFTKEKAVQDQIKANEDRNAGLQLPNTPQPNIIEQIVAESEQGDPSVSGGGMPGGMPGAMPGAMPGGMPGGMPGSMPGAMPGSMPGASYGGIVRLQDGGEAQGYADDMPTILKRQGLDYLINQLLSGMPGRESQDYEDWLAGYDESMEGVQHGVVPDWIGPGGVGRLRKLPEMITKSLKNPFATASRVREMGNRAWLGATGRGGQWRVPGRPIQEVINKSTDVVPFARPGVLVGKTPGTAAVHVPGPGTAVLDPRAPMRGVNPLDLPKIWPSAPSAPSALWNRIKEVLPYIGTAGAGVGLASLFPGDEITDRDNPRAMDLVNKIISERQRKAALAEIERMDTSGGRDGGLGFNDILGPMQEESQKAIEKMEEGLEGIQTNLTTKTAGDLEYDKQSKAFVDTLGGYVTSPEDLKSDTMNIALDSLAQALAGSQAGRRGSVTKGMEGTLEKVMGRQDTVNRKNLELEQMMASTNIGISERDSAREHAGDTVMGPLFGTEVSEAGANYRAALDAFSRMQAATTTANATRQWSPAELDQMRDTASNLALQTMGLSDVPEEQDNEYDEYNVYFKGILERMMGEQGSLGGTGITSLSGSEDPVDISLSEDPGDISFLETLKSHEDSTNTSYIDWTWQDGERVNSGNAAGYGQHKYWPEIGPPRDVTTDMNFTDEEWKASADRQLKREVLPGLRGLVPRWDELPHGAQAQLVSIAWNYNVYHDDLQGNRPFAVAIREGDWDAVGDGIRDLASDNHDPNTGLGTNYDRRMEEADAWDAAMARGRERERDDFTGLRSSTPETYDESDWRVGTPWAPPPPTWLENIQKKIREGVSSGTGFP